MCTKKLKHTLQLLAVRCALLISSKVAHALEQSARAFLSQQPSYAPVHRCLPGVFCGQFAPNQRIKPLGYLFYPERVAWPSSQHKQELLRAPKHRFPKLRGARAGAHGYKDRCRLQRSKIHPS